MLGTVGPGQTLLADRTYDSDALRQALAARGARANIKPLRNRLSPPPFSATAYRSRNLIERFFNKLKHYRAVATRYEKHAANYLALVQLTAAQIWMRFMSRSPSVHWRTLVHSLLFRTPAPPLRSQEHLTLAWGGGCAHQGVHHAMATVSERSAGSWLRVSRRSSLRHESSRSLAVEPAPAHGKLRRQAISPLTAVAKCQAVRRRDGGADAGRGDRRVRRADAEAAGRLPAFGRTTTGMSLTVGRYCGADALFVGAGAGAIARGRHRLADDCRSCER